MIADHVEPMALLIGKLLFLFLLPKPYQIIGIDALGKGNEFVVLVYSETNERNQVRENPTPASAFNSGFLQNCVGLPQLGFGPEARRGLDAISQVFYVFKF